MQQTVLDWLDATTLMHPNKIVFYDTLHTITFDTLRTLARRGAGQLLDKIDTGDPVIVMTGRHVYTPACYMAVVYAGGFYAPIDPSMPTKRLAQMVDITGGKVMIVDREHYDLAKRIGFEGKMLLMEDIFEGELWEKALQARREMLTEDRPLYLIFTSGSSGVPKGVLTSHHSLMCYIESVRDVLDIQESDRLGGQSPLDYIAAIRDMYLPYLTGASTLIIPKKYFSVPVQLFDVLTEYQVTAICWSVAGITLPAQNGAFECAVPKNIRKVCFSGSVMPCRYLKIWQQYLPDALYVNQYGPTEATASCTYYVVREQVDDDTVLPIGKPYKGYRVFVMKDGQLAKNGEVGEICIAGAPLALGYYRDPERTGVAFVKNPLNDAYDERIYKTGDLGCFNEEGILLYRGRMDRQIKLFGHRVELDEVEKTLMEMADIKECHVLFYKEKEMLYLYYTGEASRKDVVITLRNQLPAFMVPRKVVQLEVMPALPNGKTDMQALKQMMMLK